MHDRIDSVNSLLKKEIGRIIMSDVKDPRLAKVISVVHVDTSRNLQTASVYISVFGSEIEKTKTLKGLISARAFIERVLRSELTIRSIPRIRFILDDSFDKGEQISKLLTEIESNPEQA